MCDGKNCNPYIAMIRTITARADRLMTDKIFLVPISIFLLRTEPLLLFFTVTEKTFLVLSILWFQKSRTIIIYSIYCSSIILYTGKIIKIITTVRKFPQTFSTCIIVTLSHNLRESDTNIKGILLARKLLISVTNQHWFVTDINNCNI